MTRVVVLNGEAINVKDVNINTKLDTLLKAGSYYGINKTIGELNKMPLSWINDHYYIIEKPDTVMVDGHKYIITKPADDTLNTGYTDGVEELSVCGEGVRPGNLAQTYEITWVVDNTDDEDASNWRRDWSTADRVEEL